MSEHEITFKSQGFEIEGWLDTVSGEQGVVVTHPHPLYGGDMENPVVESVVAAYRKTGFSTLRFNFRGVGRSEGRYGEGISEQQDVLSAISFLTEQGISRIHLAGYSFGAWVNAHVNLSSTAVQASVMISPPTAFMDFQDVAHIPSLKLVVTGSRDELAPPNQIERRISTWNPHAELMVIPGADHFYFPYIKKLEIVLSEWLRADVRSPIS